jgi:hypothetical protein
MYRKHTDSEHFISPQLCCLGTHSDNIMHHECVLATSYEVAVAITSYRDNCEIQPKTVDGRLQ